MLASTDDTITIRVTVLVNQRVRDRGFQVADGVPELDHMAGADAVTFSGRGPNRTVRSGAGRLLALLAVVGLLAGVAGVAVNVPPGQSAIPGTAPQSAPDRQLSAGAPASRRGRRHRLSALPTMVPSAPSGGGSGAAPTSPLAGVVGDSGSPFAAPPGTARSTTAGGSPRLLGALDPSATVSFALVLRMPGQAAIEPYLASLYDPASPNYRHFTLSAAEFGARFGLPQSRISGLEAWARAAGLTVLGGYDQRTALRLEATAATLSSLFSVHLASYVDATSGVSYHAPLNAPTIPAEIADAVTGLAGLNTRPFTSAARAMATSSPKAVPNGGMGPVDLATAYDIIPLYQAGFLGEGQTIAVISFDTYLDADIAAFDKEYGIDGPAVKRVAVGATVPKAGKGAVEVTLDIEIVREIAPHAQILNFEGINGKVSQSDVIDAIVQDGRADIVSDSWGRCDDEDSFGVGDRERGLLSVQAAAAKGDQHLRGERRQRRIRLLGARPDRPAPDGRLPLGEPLHHQRRGNAPRRPRRRDLSLRSRLGGVPLDGRHRGRAESHRRATRLAEGARSGERPLEREAPGTRRGGGRRSRHRPSSGSPSRVTTDGSWMQIGGTSAAAPFWAGSMALIRQVALNKGVGRLGFVNPMLYELAAGPDAATIFHDVTRGGNLDQPAGPGWDYATGLGSPDVTALAGAIVSYLNEHPVK